jgi:hypothetical protein
VAAGARHRAVTHVDHNARGSRRRPARCLNSDDTRVKGWVLYGRQINADGSLTDLTLDALAGPRPNCDTWKQRVDCPANEIATAAVLDFDSGSTPRAWKGISLKCRAVTVQ